SFTEAHGGGLGHHFFHAIAILDEVGRQTLPLVLHDAVLEVRDRAQALERALGHAAGELAALGQHLAVVFRARAVDLLALFDAPAGVGVVALRPLVHPVVILDDIALRIRLFV